jgi:hypothetical protein
MDQSKRIGCVTRNSILRLLSDEEIASVSMAETATRVVEGDEYVDLIELDQGVRCATGPVAPMSSVLPRKAVHPDTWDKIIVQLALSAETSDHSSS